MISAAISYKGINLQFVKYLQLMIPFSSTGTCAAVVSRYIYKKENKSLFNHLQGINQIMQTVKLLEQLFVPSVMAEGTNLLYETTGCECMFSRLMKIRFKKMRL